MKNGGRGTGREGSKRAPNNRKAEINKKAIRHRGGERDKEEVDGEVEEDAELTAHLSRSQISDLRFELSKARALSMNGDGYDDSADDKQLIW